MSFNKAIQPSISFVGFRKRAIINPDGWGIAYYPDKAAAIIKEPIKASESSLSRFIIENDSLIKSKIFIAHVRKASIGIISHKNTHPFMRELNGRSYVFAHNGTIFHYKKLELSNFHPLGNTDSEYLFCHLLHLIKNRGIKYWKDEDFRWLQRNLNSINKKGRLNCVFSDGRHLFCYKDLNTDQSLCFIQRKSPFKRTALKDEDWNIKLPKIKDSSQEGYVISSKKLTDEDWKEINGGDLLVFKNGRFLFGNA